MRRVAIDPHPGAVLGITRPMLAITGLLMYWNRKLRPMAIKLRSQRSR